MPKGYAQRIRQSGWFDIALALLLISAILFISGSLWQKEEAIVVTVLNDFDEPEVVVKESFRPAFELYGTIALTATVLFFTGAVLSSWFHRSFTRLRRGRRAVSFLQFLLCLLLTIMMIFPIYWMVVTSLLTGGELLQEVPVFLPSRVSLENYRHVTQNTPFGQYVVNTFVTAGLILFGQVTVGTLAAYGFSKGQFKGKSALFSVVLGAIAVPAQALYVPLFTMVSSLNWVNTYPGLILPNLLSGFFIFLLRQAFLSVDDSYLDAAKLDGMGRIRIIAHVLIPMSKSTFAATCLITLMREWNSYIWPKMITTNEKRRTIALGIQHLLRASGVEGVHYNEVMAAAVMAVLPILFLFIVFNRYLATDVEEPPIR